MASKQPNSFLKALFPGIKYSVAPIHTSSRGTCRIGEIVPVKAFMLNGGESISIDMGHLIRFAPTSVPVMEGYEVTFDAFKVPLSSLAYATRNERDVFDFHNLRLNPGTKQNPFCVLPQNMRFRWGADVTRAPHSTPFRPGSLGDYLDFPSLKAFRNYVREVWLPKSPFFDGPISGLKLSTDSGYELSLVHFLCRVLVGNYTSLKYSEEFPNSSEFPIYSVDSVVGGSSLSYLPGFLFSPSSSQSLPSSYSSLNSNISTIDNSSLLFFDNRLPDLSLIGLHSIYSRSLLGYIWDNYESVRRYYLGNTPWFGEYLDGALVSIDDIDQRFADYYLVLKNRLDNIPDFNLNYLDVLYQLEKIDAQSIFTEWFENELIPALLFNTYLVSPSGSDLMDLGYLPDFYNSESPIDWSWFGAYWKVISDWYINTNIDGDPDDFYLNHFRVLGSTVDKFVDMKPFNRRWSNDVFTTALPDSSARDIAIPVDGTIPDLREANAYQKLVDILRNTGSRLRDVVYGVRGYRPNALASEMSEPIGTLHSYFGIQSILQTSQTTIDSPQASYSGIATDSSSGKFNHLFKVINNDEPTPVIILVLMSVTQNATYFQGFNRRFFRKSIYDFAIPELANIGEQEIYNREVYFDFNGSGEAAPADAIFGFNRRYYDWFMGDSNNEVHGEMRDSQDFWTGARIFDSDPSLNPEFIGMDSKIDHLGRIFANTSDDAQQIYYNVYFEGEKIVGLPRYIQYLL